MCSNTNSLKIKVETSEYEEEIKNISKIDESSPILIATKTVPEIQCGEIAFVNECFQLRCNYCHCKFLRIKSFLQHFIKLHLNLNQPENVLKQILCEEPSDESFDIKSNSDANSEVPPDPDWKSQIDLKVDTSLKNEQSDPENDLIEQDDNNIEDDDDDDNDNGKDDDEKSYSSDKLDDPAYDSKNDIDKDLNLTCKTCNKIFKRKGDLKRHEKSGHGPNGGKKVYKYKYVYDPKRFICETCGKGFKTNYHLKQHQHVHTGERPYKCEICPQTFAKSRHMVFHMRYHTNDRRYKCQYCDKAFVEQTKRRLHEMIHTGTFPFKCSLCDKGFRCRSKLNVHVKRHENDRMYKCDQCDKSFFDINLLRGHAAVHSDEKPFACEICPARFPRKGALRLHMHLHSEKKRYACKECGKEFHQYNGIYTHMKSHGIKYSTAYEKGETDGKTDIISNNDTNSD